MAGWFPSPEDLGPDPVWPLRPSVCRSCWLVQLPDPSPPESDSLAAPVGVSPTLREHARAFVGDLVERGAVGQDARVVEVASHATHLRPAFQERGLVTTVIEAAPAIAAGIRTAGGRVVEAALDGPPGTDDQPDGSVDCFVDHYLLAHLERPGAALGRVARMLRSDAWAVIEFDHLLPTITGRQVDAFRHGHRSYLSLGWLAGAAADVGLVVVDAVEQPVYGGALRVFLRPAGRRRAAARPAVARILAAEGAAGLRRVDAYQDFAAAAEIARAATVEALRQRAAAGAPMLGYGAPARAVTLLNYYGLDPAVLPATADLSPVKQGRRIPGVGVPIVSVEELRRRQPANVLILVWDLAAEVVQQLAAGGRWSARYWVPIPELRPVPALDGQGAFV